MKEIPDELHEALTNLAALNAEVRKRVYQPHRSITNALVADFYAYAEFICNQIRAETSEDK